MTIPSVLIVTSTFQRSQLLLQAGRSVLNQVYPHWRWHIIDDCSQDDGRTQWVIKLLVKLDSRISSSRSPYNIGAGDAKRPYMMNATSDYLVSLDDDDYWEPQFLSFLVGVGEIVKEKPVIFSDCWAVTSKGYRYWDCSKGKPFPNILPSCAVMRTKEYIKVGGWNPRLKDYHAEAELYIKMGGFHKLHHVRLPLVYWRDSDNAMSKNPIKSGKGLVTLVAMHPEMPKTQQALYIARAGLHFIEGGDKLTGQALFIHGLQLYPLTLEAIVGLVMSQVSSKGVVMLGNLYRKYLGMKNKVYKEVPPQWWKGKYNDIRQRS